MKIKRFNENKIYEKLNIGQPKVGDYVIAIDNNLYVIKDILKFEENNIGKIIKIKQKEPSKFPFIVQYENIPVNIKTFFNSNVSGSFPNFISEINSRDFSKNEIIYWSKNKEDLEIILTAKNFNL